MKSSRHAHARPLKVQNKKIPQSALVPTRTEGKQGAASEIFFEHPTSRFRLHEVTNDVGRFAAQKYITQGSLYGPILPAPAETARLTGLLADPERPQQIRRDVMFRSL